MLKADDYDYINPDDAKILLDEIEYELDNKFQRIRNQSYNPNTKGYDYEKILAKFLRSYLGNAYRFVIRKGVLDCELKVKEIFKGTENEFDTLAIHGYSVPMLVHHRLIPYDSIAFLIEVKQTLTVTSLEADLIKLGKLEGLKAIDRSSFVPIVGNFPIPKMNRPLRILFYYEPQADLDKVKELLEVKYKTSWDICVVFSKVVIVNTNLPLIKLVLKRDDVVWEQEYPLLKAMFITCIHIAGYFEENWLIFWNLFRSQAKEVFSHHEEADTKPTK